MLDFLPAPLRGVIADTTGFSRYCRPMSCGPARSGLLDQGGIAGDEVPVHAARTIERRPADYHHMAVTHGTQGHGFAGRQQYQAAGLDRLTFQLHFTFEHIQCALRVFSRNQQRSGCLHLHFGIQGR